MTHLKIEQNDNVEVVTYPIIQKLYECCISGELDAESNLKGNLQATKAYLSECNTLMQNYSDLNITIGTNYVEFEDPIARQVFANNFGDGFGITDREALNVTTLQDWFRGSNLQHMFPLSVFPNLNRIFTYAFQGSKITSLDLTGYNYPILYATFENCTELETVTGATQSIFGNLIVDQRDAGRTFAGCTKLKPFDISWATSIHRDAFMNCSSWDGELNLPNLDPNSVSDRNCLGNGAFEGTAITKIVNLGNVEKINGGVRIGIAKTFRNCHSLVSAIIPATVNYFGSEVFQNCENLKWVKFLSTTPPEMELYDSDPEWCYGVPNNLKAKIYVPDESYEAYIVADGWSYIYNNTNNKYPGRLLRPMSEFATDFPDDV